MGRHLTILNNSGRSQPLAYFFYRQKWAFIRQ
jgi:hypothetical protein